MSLYVVLCTKYTNKICLNQMEHCFFCNNIKSKMEILNLIQKIYFNQKTLTKNIFLKFVYVFINAGIG